MILVSSSILHSLLFSMCLLSKSLEGHLSLDVAWIIQHDFIIRFLTSLHLQRPFLQVRLYSQGPGHTLWRPPFNLLLQVRMDWPVGLLAFCLLWSHLAYGGTVQEVAAALVDLGVGTPGADGRCWDIMDTVWGSRSPLAGHPGLRLGIVVTFS